MTDRATDISRHALSLPIGERIEIAQQLWQSLPDPNSEETADPHLLEEIRRRDAELADGTACGRTHDEVMESMRRAIECR